MPSPESRGSLQFQLALGLTPDRASSVHKTQKDAETAAREMLRHQGFGIDGVQGVAGSNPAVPTL